MMIRIFVLLSLLAAGTPVFGLWAKSLKVRFDVNPFGIGSSSFIEMPQSNSSASAKDWAQVVGPDAPAGYESLALWCPTDDYTICTLYDDTGYIAGLQIAFDQSRFSSWFDQSTQGFTNWTASVNGVNTTFSTIRQYFISTDTLATDAESRIAARDSKLLLQDDNLYVTGFNGVLYNISTTVKNFTTNSVYTKQACIPWMGQHYYYNMTTNLPCEADTMFPWFPLVYDNQLIGVGYVVIGQYTIPKGSKNYFEQPGKLAAKVIVPRGPKCLYDLAGSPGLITMHTYFIRLPQLVTCIF